MSLDLVLSAEAEADLDDAWRWYEHRQQGLGDSFLLCVGEALARIRHVPDIAPRRSPGSNSAVPLRNSLPH